MFWTSMTRGTSKILHFQICTSNCSNKSRVLELSRALFNPCSQKIELNNPDINKTFACSCNLINQIQPGDHSRDPSLFFASTHALQWLLLCTKSTSPLPASSLKRSAQCPPSSLTRAGKTESSWADGGGSRAIGSFLPVPPLSLCVSYFLPKRWVDSLAGGRGWRAKPVSSTDTSSSYLVAHNHSFVANFFRFWHCADLLDKMCSSSCFLSFTACDAWPQFA